MRRRRKQTAALLALVFLAALAGLSPAGAAGGALDRSFGRGGVAAVDFPGWDCALALAVQKDGRVLGVGMNDASVAVVRWTRDGKLDRTFSGDGKLKIGVGQYPWAFGIALAQNGSIYVAGYTNTYRTFTGDEVADIAPQLLVDGWRLMIIKLRPNGTLDRSFGGDGIVTTGLDEVRPIDQFDVDFALTPDGGVLVLSLGGKSLGFYGGAWDTLILKYAASGELDQAFGVGGIAPASHPTPVPNPAAIAVQPDGRILVGLTLEEAAVTALFPESGGPGSDWIVERFTPAGELDTSFGTGGVVRWDYRGNWDTLWGIVVQRDNRILVYGEITDSDFRYAAGMIRLAPDGSFDQGFGSGGVWVRKFSEASHIKSAAVASDGRIYAVVWAAKDRSEYYVGRFSPNGSLDLSFGARGTRKIPFGWASHVALQAKRALAVGCVSVRDDGNANGFGLVAMTR
jgi:uncharacterized delta-60 repeat protein